MKRLLFLCVQNSCRSQMAEALARMKGAQSFSAGSRPSGRVHPGAVKAMQEIGYDMSAHSSKSVDAYASQSFDAVVTMGCGDACPHIPAQKHLDWDIPDPKRMDEAGFRAVRDLIARRIDELMA